MKKLIETFMIGCGVLAALCLTSCNDRISTQQEYDFTLSCWHLNEEIAPDETVEMRFTLRRQGDFTGSSYSVGYIQLKGGGDVTDSEELRLVSREAVPLGKVVGLDTSDPMNWTFTLYYRNTGEKDPGLRFFITDNFGQRREWEVSFRIEK